MVEHATNSSAGPQCVLMFHGIGEIPRWIDEDEKPYWIGWDFFEQIVAHIADTPDTMRKVVITFDDGNKSDLHAARIMAKSGLSGLFFVLAGRIGREGYLSPADLREMAEMGMTIGLHGRDHRNWRELGREELEDELVAARAEIAEASGTAVDKVAIPFGAYNRPVMRRLQRDDFARIYTSDPGLALPGAQIVRRNTVKSGHDIEDIIAMIEDRVPLAARLRRTIAPSIKRMLA